MNIQVTKAACVKADPTSAAVKLASVKHRSGEGSPCEFRSAEVGAGQRGTMKFCIGEILPGEVAAQ